MARGLGTPGGVVSDEDHRLAQAGLIAAQTSSLAVRAGVLISPTATALVTGTSATGTMTVSVGAHHWVTSRGTADGVYLGALEAAATANIAAAPGANSRIDVVYVKQNDSGSTVSPDADTAFAAGVQTGTAAVSPTKPSIPVGALEIATVTVAAGATSTNGAGVTIVNTAPLTSTRGAPVWVRTQAERDALTAYNGLSVKRIDLGGVEQQRISGAWKTVNTDPYKVGAQDVTSDVNGFFTVTHNLGTTPTAVFVQPRNSNANGGAVYSVTAVTSTTFTGRMYYNNAPSGSNTLAIYWRVDA